MKGKHPHDMTSAGDHSSYSENGHEHASAAKIKLGPDVKMAGKAKKHQVSAHNGGMAPTVIQKGDGIK